MTDTYQLLAQAHGIGTVDPRDRYKKYYINDLPVMITNDNKILCIPNSNEAKHIGITGSSSSGKSLSMNTMMDFEYWMLNRPCIEINDMQQETFEQSLSCKNQVFEKVFRKINVKPFPLPMVYVYPSTKTCRITEKRLPHIKITMPVAEIVEHLEEFYGLEGTRKYYQSKLDEFKDCQTEDDILLLIDEILPPDDKMAKNMNFKLKAIFYEIFNDNIMSITNPEAPSFLELKMDNISYKNYPLHVLIRAGLIPSIQTSDIRNYDFFATFMKFIVSSLYNQKYEDESFFKHTLLSLYVSEIDKLWNGVNNGDLIKKEIGLCGTNGRMAGIGLRWNTQNYESVPSTIRNNTKYLFVLRKNDSKEVNVINKDFNIPKSMQGDILTLKTDPNIGLFECVALTTEKFVLYDMSTGKKEYTNDAIRGTMIPPFAHHRKPNTKWSD